MNQTFLFPIAFLEVNTLLSSLLEEHHVEFREFFDSSVALKSLSSSRTTPIRSTGFLPLLAVCSKGISQSHAGSTRFGENFDPTSVERKARCIAPLLDEDVTTAARVFPEPGGRAEADFFFQEKEKEKHPHNLAQVSPPAAYSNPVASYCSIAAPHSSPLALLCR